MAKRGVAVLLLLLQIAIGEDLYWVPQSNWAQPSNWKLGRTPCSGDTADFSQVPRGALIHFDRNATVRSITLPKNGSVRLVLKPGATLRFSEKLDPACSKESPAADIGKAFVGAREHLWENTSNWVTSDGSSTDKPPCGKDRAIFEKGGAYSFVATNKTDLTVAGLVVRGVSLKSVSDLKDADAEFRLNLKVIPECTSSPSLCSCPSSRSGRNPGEITAAGTAGIVVSISFIVLLCVIVVAITAVFLILKKRQASYSKDEFAVDVEEGEDSGFKTWSGGDTAKKRQGEEVGGSVAFSNPTYNGSDALGLVENDELAEQEGEEEESSNVLGGVDIGHEL